MLLIFTQKEIPILQNILNFAKKYQSAYTTAL